MSLVGMIAAVVNAIPMAFTSLSAINVIAIPFAFFRRTRGGAGAVFMISAMIFALMFWISASVMIYAVWGLPALIAAIVFPPGVIPVFFAALFMHGTGTEFLGTAIMLFAAIATAVAGVKLTNSS